MATLVLTSIGTSLGGPIGGALGSLVGQSIDRGLFAPGATRGPRLGDLSVQTSSYGSPIPRLYGTMRVAGTVVWATDLREEEAIEGGGKGSPERLTYSYTANLAVALSSRPIRGVKRIWADGKLIRGTAGDFKVKTEFRLALGGEDQEVDPLIASMEGIASAPAYRGLALAIFEGLELSEFGNRIPLLTFEVVADQGPVPLSALLGDASGGLIAAVDTLPLVGFAAYGTSIRDGLSQLLEVSAVRLVERDGQLRSPEGGTASVIGSEELGCDAEKPGGSKLVRLRAPEGEMPSTLAMTYYDAARDYQAGQARASSGTMGTREERVELPAVLTAGEARRLAEDILVRRWLAGDTLKLRLSPSRMFLRPGDIIWPQGMSRTWAVRSVSIEGMVVAMEAEATATGIQSLPADPGRPVSEPDVPVGRSQLILFEIPSDGEVPAQAPRVLLAASNAGQWKALPVHLSLGDQPLSGLALTRRAIVGQAETALHHRTPMILDNLSQVTVRLSNEAHILLNADANALMAGANLALVGEELIQFGKAEQLGPGLYRLAKLLRGRRGTEWAASGHSAGENFCLIDAAALVGVELGSSAVGATLHAVAHGIGDTAPLPQAIRLVSGEAMRPPPPCHLEVTRVGQELQLSWVRRSHRLWAWLDGIGDGADSFPELYRLIVQGTEGQTVFETANPSINLAPSQLPGQVGQSITISVVTVGSAAWSRPATASLIL